MSHRSIRSNRSRKSHNSVNSRKTRHSAFEGDLHIPKNLPPKKSNIKQFNEDIEPRLRTKDSEEPTTHNEYKSFKQSLVGLKPSLSALGYENEPKRTISKNQGGTISQMIEMVNNLTKEKSVGDMETEAQNYKKNHDDPYENNSINTPGLDARQQPSKILLDLDEISQYVNDKK